ncbi:MAG: ribosome biogenesis GTPase Der [Ignavibacteriales bacterium]|nr:ribosome biogenesis GTPase Der [Ignavibacteriales bacterium]
MSNYLIAIIGRPNVGKSTLFNRIIGERNAIVHDLPGVTRDRHYAEAEWAGKQFTLVDTGGFLPNSDDVFDSAIREQAQIAINESDAIIFLVDAEQGVTSADEELATIIRKSQKPIFIVVNKIDSDKRENRLGEFYKLGLGEPISISALGGRRIGDFLDTITEAISESADDTSDERLRLAIVGRPNVGKSSIVNTLLGKTRTIVTHIAGTTRDPIDSILKINKEEILLIDTAGLRKKSKIEESVEFYSTLRTIKSIERCNVAIVVIDASVGLEKQDFYVIERAVEARKGILLCGNKWDLVEKDDKTAIKHEIRLREQLREYDYLPIMFVSALTKQRILKIIESAKEINEERGKRIPTTELNKHFEDTFFNSPPPSKSGKDISLKYVTQTKVNPPIFLFFAKEPKLITENYRRYLERLLREGFGFAGVPLTLQFRKK